MYVDSLLTLDVECLRHQQQVRTERIGEQTSGALLRNHASGKKQLAVKQNRWERLVEAVESILSGRPEESAC